MPRAFRTGGVPFVVAWPILALCYAAPAPGKTVDGTATRPTSGPALQVQDLGKARRNVLVERDGESVNLTRFSRPQVIFEFAASADGRWAYVWHHERPPRVLSIYDLQSMELVCSFSPGAGGSLLWTPANTILHWWGGGTDCRIYAIYNVRGKTLCGGIAGAVEVSPDQNYLATFPTGPYADEPLVIQDLRTLEVVYTSKGKADVRTVEEYAWREAGLQIQYTDSKDRAGTLLAPLGKR